MKGVEYGEYPPTPFAPFDAEADTQPLPPPPRLPSEVAATLRPAPLDDMAMRVADLSDALHDPGGLVHRLFQDVEDRAAARHEEVMRTLRDIADGVAVLSATVNRMVPEQARHAAALHLVTAAASKPAKKRATRVRAAE